MTGSTHAPVRRVRCRACAAVVVAALIAGGCGSDDGGASSSDAGSTAATVDGPAPPIDLDDLAAASGEAPAAAGAGIADGPGSTGRRGLAGTTETAASITGADGTVRACCLLVVADDETRQRGLMEVTDLAGYTGMVFVWSEDRSGGFWMRNTPMPLSIAFFDAAGRFVASTDMEPCDDSPDCPGYPSPGSYRFAIEVPQGDLAALGVGPGSVLALGDRCAPAGAAP